MIEESQELLNSGISKSSSNRDNNNFTNFLLSKIDGKAYIGFIAMNFRGKNLENCQNKMIKLIDIFKNKEIYRFSDYSISD